MYKICTIVTQRCFFLPQLVDWLIGQDTNTSRSQAVAIGQALLTGGFFSGIGGQAVFADNADLYQERTEPG
jgi:hypothetical protein